MKMVVYSQEFLSQQKTSDRQDLSKDFKSYGHPSRCQSKDNLFEVKSIRS